MKHLHIGLAGWSSLVAKKKEKNAFTGSPLQKYARLFTCVELNASFYRNYSAESYRKWADQTGKDFLFSVKMSRNITHFSQLKKTDELQIFLENISVLGDKLRVLLIQLPPSLTYEEETVKTFFNTIRKTYTGPIACEPRNETWFNPSVDSEFKELGVSGVAASPCKFEMGSKPFGDLSLVYYRMHGDQKLFFSSYPDLYLKELYNQIQEEYPGAEKWVIFNNTASAAGEENALYMKQLG